MAMAEAKAQRGRGDGAGDSRSQFPRKTMVQGEGKARERQQRQGCTWVQEPAAVIHVGVADPGGGEDPVHVALQRVVLGRVGNMLVTRSPKTTWPPLLFLLKGKEGSERGCGLFRPLSGARSTSDQERQPLEVETSVLRVWGGLPPQSEGKSLSLPVALMPSQSPRFLRTSTNQACLGENSANAGFIFYSLFAVCYGLFAFYSMTLAVA